MRRFSSFIILTLLFSFAVFTPIFAQQTPIDGCTYDGNPTRPGGNCKTRVPYVQTNISQYPLQCAVTPTTVIAGKICGNRPQTVNLNDQEYIDARLLLDFNKLQLGGLGPDQTAWSTYDLDSLARVYPHNGLGDKPLVTSTDTPREAYRTWWRLLTIRQQIAAKAEFFTRFSRQNPPIFDSAIPFQDPTSSSSVGDAIPRHIEEPPTHKPPIEHNSPCAAGEIDMLDYVIQDDENLVKTMQNGSQLQTYQTTINDKPSLIFYKGGPRSYEELTYDDQWIYHLRDTTWNQQCEDGTTAYYSVFKPGTDEEGGQFMPRCMAPGREYAVNSEIRAYSQGTCKPCNTKLGTHKSAFGTTIVLNDLGNTSAGVFNGRVITITNVGGGAAGEVATYGLGHGFIGFTDTQDFAAGDFVQQFSSIPPRPVQNVCTEAGDDYKISELIGSLPYCLTNYDNNTGLANTCGGEPIEQTYYNLDPKTKAMYDAFLPFNFDNVRGYLSLNYLKYDNGNTSKQAGLLAENLPYVQAVLDELGNKAGGILNTLSPNWLNLRRSPTNYGDYYNYRDQEFFNLTVETLPLINLKPETEVVFEPITNKTQEAWASDLVCRDNSKENPSLQSPLTYPTNLPISQVQTEYVDLSDNDPGSLNQSLLVPVEIETHSGTLTNTPDGTKCLYSGTSESCSYNAENSFCPDLHLIKRREEEHRNPEDPVRSATGRGIASFTNPLMSNVSKLVSEPDGGNNNSLFYQFLPRTLAALGFASQTDTPIFAKEVTYAGDSLPEGVEQKVHAGDSDKETASVKRKGGQLEIDLCKLRNFWLRPAGLQAGTPDDCENLDTFISSPTNTSIPGVTTGSSAGELCVQLWVDPGTASSHAANIQNILREQKDHWFDYYGGNVSDGYLQKFARNSQCSLPQAGIVGAKSCTIEQFLFRPNIMSQVINTASSTSCQAQVINPYFAIAVALNETGGLASDNTAGTNIKHMGCDPFNALGYSPSISDKLSCFSRTIGGDCGKTETEILSEYGYLSTQNLNSILNTLGVCSR